MDIDRVPISFGCPQCGFENEATFQDARLCRRIICRGCKVEIHLEDHENSVGQSRKNINEAIDSLSHDINIDIKL